MNCEVCGKATSVAVQPPSGEYIACEECNGETIDTQTTLWQSSSGKVWKDSIGNYGTMGSTRQLACELAEESYRNEVMVRQVIGILGEHKLKNVLEIGEKLAGMQATIDNALSMAKERAHLRRVISILEKHQPPPTPS